MEQKVILKTNEQCIYLIKEKNLDFYLVIPNNRQVSIVLGLFPSVDENSIKSLPKVSDKAIVVPVINSVVLEQANKMEANSFKYLDNVLSFLINTSYKLLTYNHLEVNSKILINNHSLYQVFIQKYIEKYQGRVELYDLMPKQESKPMVTFSNQEIEKNKEQSAMTNERINMPNSTLDEDIEPILNDEPVVTSSEVKEAHEPGFVSYVLLGVLVAVISLVFLYLML